MADLSHIGGNPALDPNIAHVHEGTGVKSLGNTTLYPDTEEGIKELSRQQVTDLIEGARGNFGDLMGNFFEDVFKNIADALLAGAGFVVQGLSALVAGVVDAFKKVLNFLAEALFGTGTIPNDLRKFRDGQLEINNRVDLLEGVSGYCAAYQSVNINTEWSTDKWRTIPYDKQLGPAKGMSVDTAKGQIVLDTKGFYIVYAKAHARATLYGGNNYGYLDVQVLSPSGAVYSTSRVENFIERNHDQTFTLAWPVVVPGPNYRVQVRVYSDNWRWWDGGTAYSTLNVIRHSQDARNTGQSSVPDEAKR